jgi:hypothetical protein
MAFTLRRILGNMSMEFHQRAESGHRSPIASAGAIFRRGGYCAPNAPLMARF